MINPAAQAQNQGYELAHPNIHPDCDPLEHVKGLVLQTQSCRISMTQDNNRRTRKTPRKGLSIDSVAGNRGLKSDQ